jgi:hypothetical protein
MQIASRLIELGGSFDLMPPWSAAARRRFVIGSA